MWQREIRALGFLALASTACSSRSGGQANDVDGGASPTGGVNSSGGTDSAGGAGEGGEAGTGSATTPDPNFSEFGEPCRADTSQMPDGTGEGLCLPRFAPLNGLFFSDSACSEPLATGDSSGTPLLVSSTQRELFALGDAYDGPAFISYAMGANCQSFPTDTGSFSFFRIGEPLPPGTVAPIQLRPRGSGRLGLQMIESDAQAVAPIRHRDLSTPARSNTGPYLDQDLGVLCQPAWTVTGEVRCVPSNAWFASEGWTTTYADPACTQAIVPSKVDTLVLVRADPAITRQVVVAVHKVGAEPTATAYSKQGSQCVEFLKGAGYPVGDPIPLESFARLEARTGAEPAM